VLRPYDSARASAHPVAPHLASPQQLVWRASVDAVPQVRWACSLSPWVSRRGSASSPSARLLAAVGSATALAVAMALRCLVALALRWAA